MYNLGAETGDANADVEVTYFIGRSQIKNRIPELCFLIRLTKLFLVCCEVTYM